MTESFREGEVVVRYLGDNKPFMRMKVVKVIGHVVECAAIKDDGTLARLGWTFDRDTGAEIDEDLEWGPHHGRTGSVIRREE